MKITFEKFGKYEGKWIALDKKKESVLASGKTVTETSKKLKKSDSGALFMYVNPFNAYLAPSSSKR